MPETAQRFDRKAEQQLLNCAKEAQAYVADGMTPDEALAKAASDVRLPFHMLPLAVSAYNTGAQTYQQEKVARNGGGVLELVQDFPIARIEQVRAMLYPSKEASVAQLKAAAQGGVSREYLAPPKPVAAYREKAAEAVRSYQLPKLEARQAPPLHPAQSAIFAKQAAHKAVEEARLKAGAARDEAVTAVGRLRGYFKTENHLPESEVISGGLHLFGKQAASLFSYLFPGRELTKTARLSTPAMANQRPYSLVKAAIDALHAATLAKSQYEKLTAELPAKEAAIFAPFDETPASHNLLDNPRPLSGEPIVLAKRAGIFSPVLTGLSAGIGSTLRKDPAKQVAGLESRLDDPDHVEELKAINARAVLHDMINNDEVISGYDPNEIIDVYNELVQVAPGASTRPAMLRPLLRQRLTAGSLQPFDVQQLSNIEKEIRTTQTSPVTAGQTGSLIGDIGYVAGA